MTKNNVNINVHFIETNAVNDVVVMINEDSYNSLVDKEKIDGLFETLGYELDMRLKEDEY